MLLGVGIGLAAFLLCLTALCAAVYLALAVQGLASSLIAWGAALRERIGRFYRQCGWGHGHPGCYLPAGTGADGCKAAAD